MAGLLNAIYLVAASIVAIAGLALVVNAMNDSEAEGASWAELSLMALGVVFVVGLAAEFLM
jgi:heme/copper-type cytochrome/quinol oxidase subunit 3